METVAHDEFANVNPVDVTHDGTTYSLYVHRDPDPIKLPEFTEEWLEALKTSRLGDKNLRQGHGELATGMDFGGYAYCCLGVLCELFEVKFAGQLDIQADPGQIRYDGNDAHLPGQVSAKAYLRTNDGHLEPCIKITRDDDDDTGAEPQYYESLTEINDDGVPFAVIAEIIRLQPLGLFAKPAVPEVDNAAPASV